MRAKELIPILAEKYGIPFETAFMIDRSLFEAGFRAKGKGRALPQMSREEALIFLVACIVTLRPTKAAQEVAPWLDAGGLLFQPHPASDLEEGEDNGFPLRRFAFEHIAKHMAPLYVTDARGKQIAKIIPFLLVVCHLLETNMFSMFGLRLVFDFSQHFAAVEVMDHRLGPVDTYHFHLAEDRPAVDPETGIMRTAFVYKEALEEIISRTENPLIFKVDVA